MNPRDLFKGKTPNAGLAPRNAFENERMFSKMTAPEVPGRADAPGLRFVYRRIRESEGDASAGPRARADGRPDTEREAAARVPVTVHDAGSRAPSGDRTGWFGEMVAPLEPAEFAQTLYLEKRPALFRGNPERFASLLTWDELNAILATGLLSSPRLRLFRDGTMVPIEVCQVPDFGHRWRGANRNRLDAHRLETFLRRGATLILDEMDEIHPPIRALAEDIEAALGTYSQVNLYASWASVQGFATHWDGHDVLIVQVAGHKRWHLFGESRRSPLDHDVNRNLKADAPRTTVWSEVLRPGDVLYVPRGWWHDARSENPDGSEGTGSLHLTCGLGSVNGVDLMRWLTARLACHEPFRRDLPLPTPDGKHEPHFAALRDLIVSALDGDFARKFQDFRDAAWSERRRPAIDAHIQPWKSPDWDRCEIRLRGAGRAVFEPGNPAGAATLRANGYTWSFDPACADLIAPLAKAGRMTLASLRAVAPERFPADFVDGFARLLIEEGAAYAVLPERRLPAAGR